MSCSWYESLPAALRYYMYIYIYIYSIQTGDKVEGKPMHVWMLDYSEGVWGPRHAGMARIHPPPQREESLLINTKLFSGFTFILRWNISILMAVVSSRMTMSQFTGHEGSQNGLMDMKIMSLICCDLHSHQISTEFIICGIFWTEC